MDFGLSLELNIKQELYPEFVETAGNHELSLYLSECYADHELSLYLSECYADHELSLYLSECYAEDQRYFFTEQ